MIPDEVDRSVRQLLKRVDTAIPGVVDGAYLTGSVALGDFQPEISDIDAVFVTASPLDDQAFEVLPAVHRPASPHVDVLYLTSDELRLDPALARGPHSNEGAFHPSGAFAANPVEWRTLQTRAVTLCGPKLASDDIWFEPEALRAWNLANLHDYWDGRIEWLRTCEATEAIVRWEYGLQWIVLGVARLHHTIVTLEITSKTGAGRYALDIADGHWHAVIETAMALRLDRDSSLPLSPGQLRNDAVELVSWLVEDAARAGPPPSSR